MGTLDDLDLLVLTEMSPEKPTRKSVSFNPTVLQQDFDPEISDLDARNRLMKDLDEMVENRTRINLEIQEALARETASNQPEPKSCEKTTEVSLISFQNRNSFFSFKI